MTTKVIRADHLISAADANRQFSRVLREVREGRTYVVTSHGRPVARIVPADGRAHADGAALDTFLARLEEQPVSTIGSWTRDELYEDDDR
jgi:prevent-host-death family protein